MYWYVKVLGYVKVLQNYTNKIGNVLNNYDDLICFSISSSYLLHYLVDCKHNGLHVPGYHCIRNTDDVLLG